MAIETFGKQKLCIVLVSVGKISPIASRLLVIMLEVVFVSVDFIVQFWCYFLCQKSFFAAHKVLGQYFRPPCCVGDYPLKTLSYLILLVTAIVK